MILKSSAIAFVGWKFPAPVKRICRKWNLLSMNKRRHKTKEYGPLTENDVAVIRDMEILKAAAATRELDVLAAIDGNASCASCSS